MTVLLWGTATDPVLRAVADACERRAIPVLTADSDSIERLEEGVLVKGAGDTLALDAVSGVLVRPAAELATKEAAQAYHRLNAWVQLSPARVMNRPDVAATNRSKPYQLALICGAGFAVPDTLVTTDPAQVRQFRDRHGRVIYKSVSGTRSIVAELTSDDDNRLADVTVCPTQFQQHIPGTDYRVHVVDRTVYACRIDSTATDYRYPLVAGQTTTLHAWTLPAEIELRCIALSAALGLGLAGIDLRQDPDGGWWCFEVNTAPGFIWFEQQTGLPIADAIARALAADAPDPGRIAETPFIASCPGRP